MQWHADTYIQYYADAYPVAPENRADAGAAACIHLYGHARSGMRTRMYSSMHLKIERPRAAPREDSLWSIFIATCVEDSSGRPCRSTKSSCIRMLTSAYVSIRQHTRTAAGTLADLVLCQHTSAYVSSIRQHASAYVRTIASATADLQSRQGADATYAADVC